MSQYPLTSFVTPVVMLIAVIGCYLSPTTIAPLFIKLYLLWSPYHFSGQTLGITMVYARRTGFVIDGWLRRCLTAFIFLTFAGAERVGRGRPSRQPVLRRRIPDAWCSAVAAADADEADVGSPGRHDRPC